MQIVKITSNNPAIAEWGHGVDQMRCVRGRTKELPLRISSSIPSAKLSLNYVFEFAECQVVKFTCHGSVFVNLAVVVHARSLAC